MLAPLRQSALLPHVAALSTGAVPAVAPALESSVVREGVAQRYDEIGLLPRAPRTEAGYRQYGDEDAERLEFIRSAQALGIALEEIEEVLAFRDRGAYPCPYVLRLIEAKRQEVESRIQGLRFLAGDLRRLRKAAAAVPAGADRGEGPLLPHHRKPQTPAAGGL